MAKKIFHKRKFSILGEDYTVEETNIVVSPYAGEVAAAVCRESKKIFLNYNRTRAERLSDLVHELFHAFGFEINMEQLDISPDVEHLFCETFTQKVLLKHFDIRLKRK